MQKIEYIDLIQEIGAGGTASVFLGIDNHSGFPVAVKMLHNSLFKNDFVKQKFIAEANHYVYLSHPNIVKLVDLIEKEDAIYLVMEYIDGDTLEDYINKISGPIPEEIAIPILKEILSAIDFAHQQNVVHLDIKPSNIMITKDGDIKILDFGISSDLNKDMNEPKMGSPMYMSPEQVNGKNVNHKSDIYSIGITYHQMLTAHLPYPKNISREELFDIIKTKKLKRINEFVPWGSVESQKIIDKATKKTPSLRYVDCKDFTRDVLKVEKSVL
jgi:serine/threonine-protein kinase